MRPGVGPSSTVTCSGGGGQGPQIAEPSTEEWEDRYQVDRGTILQHCSNAGDTTLGPRRRAGRLP
jgi:hypothetical protein